MTPLKLTLEGFVGILHGLGKESITIDFSGYEGLVAITGENGKGKTTILDNCTPYRLMPSKIDARSSGYSPAAFSFYTHVKNKASKELIWSHGGTEYKTEILVKASATGKTKSTEAYLFVNTGTDWRPYKLEDGTESDGKNEIYDRCVVEVLGTPDAFFTSAFAAQGRAPLCDYRNADIKELLSEMLNLGRIRDLGVRANQVRAQLKNAVNSLADEARKAADLDQDIAGNESDLEGLEDSLSELRGGVESQREKASQAEVALAEEKRLAESAAGLLEQDKQLAAEIASLLEKDRNATTEARQEIDAEEAERTRDINALQAKMREATSAYKELAGKIKVAKGLFSREAEIRKDAEAYTDVVSSLEAADKAYDAAVTEREALNKAKSGLQEIEKRFSDAKNEGVHKAKALEDLRARAVLVDNVPCVGTPMNLECQLLENANQAKQKASSVEVELQDIRKRCVSLKEERDNFIEAHDVERAMEISAKVTDLSRERERLRIDKVAKQEAGRMLADLEARKEGFADLEKAAAKADDEIAEVDKAIEARTLRHQAAVDKISKRAAKLTEELAGQLAKARAAKDKLEIPRVDVPAKVMVLEQAKHELAGLEAKLEERIREIASRKAAIEQRKKDRENLEKASKKHRGLSAELSVWEQLAKALGNDGIIALSIDDAGPTISSICNDLLRECYGPRFTVGIQTQTETAKGTAKETFDIRIFDAQADEEKSIRLTSGGEGLWLNEALTRSIALFQAQQSGRAYETLFADESDGALDFKKKVEFINMKRAVLELGGYQREYFITHQPELWALADHVIDVETL